LKLQSLNGRVRILTQSFPTILLFLKSSSRKLGSGRLSEIVLGPEISRRIREVPEKSVNKDVKFKEGYLSGRN
jgi:hypothetical protein